MQSKPTWLHLYIQKEFKDASEGKVDVGDVILLHVGIWKYLYFSLFIVILFFS